MDWRLLSGQIAAIAVRICLSTRIEYSIALLNIYIYIELQHLLCNHKLCTEHTIRYCIVYCCLVQTCLPGLQGGHDPKAAACVLDTFEAG